VRAQIEQTSEPLFELRVRNLLYVKVQRVPGQFFVLANTAISALGAWLATSFWR
jgi:hypothetical protein